MNEKEAEDFKEQLEFYEKSQKFFEKLWWNYVFGKRLRPDIDDNDIKK